MYMNKLKRNFFKSLWQTNYNVYLLVPYEIVFVTSIVHVNDMLSSLGSYSLAAAYIY